jgi:ADP-ribosylglycohydrolase
MTSLDRNRFRGSLLGLAAGDAVGTTVEFKPPGTFEAVTDMVGGGPFNLPPGAWTDDTSMAMCLAESLVEHAGMQPFDQLFRYAEWWKKGYWSSVDGKCFDIGRATRLALERYLKSPEPYPGDAAPDAAGNGPIMKLAPVALAFAGHPERAVRHAGESARSTHGDPRAVDAARYFCALIVGALNGASREELLREGGFSAELVAGLHPEVASVARGSFRVKQPPEIKGNGLITLALEAALWALHTTETFEQGVLAAVNLGDDADTTAAIYGQLAGALMGVDAIPARWREKLVRHDDIQALADRLFELATDPIGTVFATDLRRITLRAPAEALERDGVLHGKGWAIRWRHRDDGAIRIHMANRMAGDSFYDIAPNGERVDLGVPGEFYIADDPGAAEANADAWRDYYKRLEEDGMAAPAGAPQVEYDPKTQLVWRHDDGAWRLG